MPVPAAKRRPVRAIRRPLKTRAAAAKRAPKAPRVSVVMPVYNAEKYLRPALESILNQTYRDLEFIIIDDASTDRSWEIVQEYARKDPRIRLLRNAKNLRLSLTLNRGIWEARGEYLVRMDSDDISLPDRVAKQVAYMDGHPEVGISGGAMQIIDQCDQVIGLRQYFLADAKIRAHIFLFSPFSHPTIILRKSVVQKAGMYNPLFNPAEDYELYFRMGQMSQFGNLPDVLLRYRVVPKSMTTGSTHRMEKKTLIVRQLVGRELGYQMTGFDRLYWFLQWVSMHFMPGRLRMWAFNLVRGWLRP